MPEYEYNPDVIRRTARKLQRNDPIETEVAEDGFVLQHSRNRQGCTFVGIQEAGGTYVVAKMFKKSEIIGRNDPKIQTSKNEYVECQLYRMELGRPTNDDVTVEVIAASIDNKDYDEKIDTGYINGLQDVAGWDRDPTAAIKPCGGGDHARFIASVIHETGHCLGLGHNGGRIKMYGDRWLSPMRVSYTPASRYAFQYHELHHDAEPKIQHPEWTP